MTPYEIDVLLWYFTRASEHPDVLRCPPVWSETRDRFLTDGLLRKAEGHERNHGASWTLTDRGVVYCEALQRVPLPEPAEPAWIIKWPADPGTERR